MSCDKMRRPKNIFTTGFDGLWVYIVEFYYSVV